MHLLFLVVLDIFAELIHDVILSFSLLFEHDSKKGMLSGYIKFVVPFYGLESII